MTLLFILKLVAAMILTIKVICMRARKRAYGGYFAIYGVADVVIENKLRRKFILLCIVTVLLWCLPYLQ